MTSCVQNRWWPVAVLLACLAVSTGAAAQSAPARERHVVVVDEHPVTVWSRQSAQADAVVLLVHGRTWSSLPGFDLDVPGLNRSVLVSLAARGLAAYAVDLRGYGATPVDPSGWLTPSRAVVDISAVVEWIVARHATLPHPVIVGWSRGGALAMLTAQRIPDRLSGVVVYGFAFDPELPFADTVAPAGPPPRAANTAEAAMSDFISPAVTAPSVIRAFVAQALAADPIRANVSGDAEFNAILTGELRVPVLFVYGDRDPSVVPAHIERLVDRLPTAVQEPTVFEGADHAAHLESVHEAWVEAVAAFVRGPGVASPRRANLQVRRAPSGLKAGPEAEIQKGLTEITNMY